MLKAKKQKTKKNFMEKREKTNKKKQTPQTLKIVYVSLLIS